MGFIKTLLRLHNNKIQDLNIACNNLISRIDDALFDEKSIFAAPQVFIDPQAAEKWGIRHQSLLNDAKINNIKRLKKSSNYSELLSKQSQLFDISHHIFQKAAQHNEHAANVKIQSAYSLIGNVEGRKLDRQQMTCVVKEAHNHLVIAGAGTGKTTTIVGKIKYLLKSGKFSPQDILVLSFTNASATEMKERIFAETGYNIEASTFHKLGLNIISKSEGRIPKITKINLHMFIKNQLNENMESDIYFNMLISYLIYNRVVSKSEFEFKSQEEYNEYLTYNPPTTVNNETVKSYGEMDITNFLERNNIKYIYEQPYEIYTSTSEHAQYYPDFYLPDYKIYIEYFGIDRKGEVPSFFKTENGKTASETYRESMEWKRNTHKKYNTKMIECFAYEKSEGKLLINLKEKLEASGVKLNPKSAKELWEKFASGNNSPLESFIELTETVINLIKSNNYDINTVRNLNHSGYNTETNNILLSLTEPIFNAYCHYLESNNEIDFNDMINLATDYVKQGKYINPYKYVIVDEYQDISKSRFKLLESLRKSNDFDLFCVGDDWQSIYRFAGSDIGFILNFSKYWGASEISKIETTYRFSQKLIEISGGFIMKNPAQIKKSIKGRTESLKFPLGEISGYTENCAFDFLSRRLCNIPRDSSVFFIGRYSFDAKLLSESGLFSCLYNNSTGLIDVKSKSYPYLKITFLTAHKSKGLQADYVFIINNKKSQMGFPAKIQDAPILNLLLDNSDNFPYGEERRLFYVALTRAKEKAFIVTIKGQESEFASEIKKNYENELKKEPFECPLCGGNLVKHSGPYGDFYGCSNYKITGCKYKRKIQ